MLKLAAISLSVAGDGNQPLIGNPLMPVFSDTAIGANLLTVFVFPFQADESYSRYDLAIEKRLIVLLT